MGNVQLKNLYVNGCSWTDGDTLDLAGLTDKGVGKKVSYPNLVAEYFNYNLFDDSKMGGSINRIIRMCWEYIFHKNISETIFILEIPNGFRDEIYSNKYGRYFNLTSGSLHNENDKTENNSDWLDIKKDVVNYFYNFCDFEEFSKKEFINFFSLISYIKNYTDEIYLIQSDELQNKIKPYKIYQNLLTDKNIIKLKDISFENEYQLIQDMCKHEKLSIGDELNKGYEDTHPGITGHKKLAEIIIKHLKFNGRNII